MGRRTDPTKVVMSSAKCYSCGEAAAKENCRQEGDNEGRAFYKCKILTTPGCSKFFKWGEQLQGGAGQDAVNCDCGDIAVREVVKKEGDNKGRIFYHCGRMKDFQCRFWEWAEKVQTSQDEGDSNFTILCGCGME